MAHFAQLDASGIVTQVIVVNNAELSDLPFPESEPLGVAFCQSLFGSDTRWAQTSYNGNFRKNYAGIGYSYDAVRDAFIPPQPYYPSWVLNEGTCQWEAPIPYPGDADHRYAWDEATLSWVLINEDINQ
jgi:hypothetical protein